MVKAVMTSPASLWSTLCSSIIFVSYPCIRLEVLMQGRGYVHAVQRTITTQASYLHAFFFFFSSTSFLKNCLWQVVWCGVAWRGERIIAAIHVCAHAFVYVRACARTTRVCGVACARVCARRGVWCRLEYNTCTYNVCCTCCTKDSK